MMSALPCDKIGLTDREAIIRPALMLCITITRQCLQTQDLI